MPSPGSLSNGHLLASDILSAPMHHGTDRNPQQPFLTPEERAAIDRGRWFSALSPSLRHDIFRLGTVTRYAHGDLIVEQGELAQHWFACASGAIRFRRTSPAGKLVTLAYVEPGIWVGEAEVLHSGPNTYDAHAHGRTTVPLRARLAKHLLHLMRRFGPRHVPPGDEVPLGIVLVQDELAQLLGCSRQRVNVELKSMEREGVIRMAQRGIIVRQREQLETIAQQET